MAKLKKFTHDELTALAVKWLKRQPSAGGPGCHMAVSELATGHNGEIPDAIGFKASQCPETGSTLVEVKVSRADFLKDKDKPHRNGQTLGVGKWRYYLCPEGLIKPEELPPKWGLIYANNRGLKVIVGAASLKAWGARRDAMDDSAFEVDVEREQYLLVRLFSRIGDTEEMSKTFKRVMKEKNDIIDRSNRKTEQINDITDQLRKARHRIRRLEYQIEHGVDPYEEDTKPMPRVKRAG